MGRTECDETTTLTTLLVQREENRHPIPLPMHEVPIVFARANNQMHRTDPIIHHATVLHLSRTITRTMSKVPKRSSNERSLNGSNDDGMKSKDKGPWQNSDCNKGNHPPIAMEFSHLITTAKRAQPVVARKAPSI
jgi:hypothetical protein